MFGEKSTFLQHNISAHQKTLKTLYKCVKCEKMFGEKFNLLHHNISETIQNTVHASPFSVETFQFFDIPYRY